jgi:hypothetical protein
MTEILGLVINLLSETLAKRFFRPNSVSCSGFYPRTYLILTKNPHFAKGSSRKLFTRDSFYSDQKLIFFKIKKTIIESSQ